ncbi:MAG: N-acetyltransferase family protein [Microgenomates group bacterium]
MILRSPTAADFDQWAALYAGYAAFYQVDQTDAMRRAVWAWLQDPDHTTSGLVAELEGRLIGLAHYRPFARPLSASTGVFLDDLFVEPTARGTGAAAALIAQIKAEARAKGWSVVRWITADDNYRARALYDKVALRTKWVTYDIKP